MEGSTKQRVVLATKDIAEGEVLADEVPFAAAFEPTVAVCCAGDQALHRLMLQRISMGACLSIQVCHTKHSYTACLWFFRV